MTASNPVFTVSDAQRRLRRGLVWSGPAISKAGVVPDMVEIGVAVSEFLADTFDESTDIGAVPLCPMAGDKVLAVDEIVDVAIADVLSCLLREKHQDLEFGQSQLDRISSPQRAIGIEAQLQLTEPECVGWRRLGIGSGPRALGDQLQTLNEDRQPPRLVDKVDRASGEGRFFVNV